MATKKVRTYDAESGPQGRSETITVPDPPLQLAPSAGPDVFDEFGPAVDVVHSVSIPVNGIVKTFHIKQHSIEGASIIEAKRYRYHNGNLVRDQAYEGMNGLVWELHYSVVQNVGTEEAPKWEPLLPSEAWAAKLQDARTEVKDLINNLCLQVWRFNDEIRPSKKKAAMAAML